MCAAVACASPPSRARRCADRSIPSGRGRDTGRSGRRCAGPTRSARRQRLLAVARRKRGRSRFGGVAAWYGGEPAGLLPVREWAFAAQRLLCSGEARRVEPSCRFAETAKRGSLTAMCGSAGSVSTCCPSSSCSGGASAARRGPRPDCDWAVAGRATESGRTHPSLGLSGSDLHLGDRAHGAAQKRAARVSRFGHRSDRCTSSGRDPYEILGFTVTSVVGTNNEKPPCGGDERELRDRDSNPNFRNQNPASYH